MERVIESQGTLLTYDAENRPVEAAPDSANRSIELDAAPAAIEVLEDVVTSKGWSD